MERKRKYTPVPDKYLSKIIEEIRDTFSFYKNKYENNYEGYKNGDIALYEKILDKTYYLESQIETIRNEYGEYEDLDILESEIEYFRDKLNTIIKIKEYIKEIIEIRDKLSEFKQRFAKNQENIDIDEFFEELNDLDSELFGLRKTQKQMNSKIDLDNVFDEVDYEIKSFMNDIRDVMKMEKYKSLEEHEIYTPRPSSRKNRKMPRGKMRKSIKIKTRKIRKNLNV